MRDDGRSDPESHPPLLASTTGRLLSLARSGDRGALDRLFSRVLPPLLRWTHGRIPRGARADCDTPDVVQEVALQTFRNLNGFVPRRRQALQAYLRQSVRNRLRDEARRVTRRTPTSNISDVQLAGTDSPLDDVLAGESRERYQNALARLPPEDRELIVSRLELGFSYEQVALATGRASPDAARMAVKRALLHLAAALDTPA